MKKFLLAGVAAAFLAAPALTYAASDTATPTAHHWMEQRAALLDAHIAGFEAALKLTPDQQKNWPAFETALRDVAKNRAAAMHEMRARREAHTKVTPIERMQMMSDRLAKGSADIKSIADAAQPLYASLDDTQKRNFGPLLRDLAREGRMGAHHWRSHMRDEGFGHDKAQ